MCQLVNQVDLEIRTRRLLGNGRSVLAAVSGGLDSMVMLHVLHRLAGSHKWRLTVAHYNHCLRGGASDADERLVKRTCRKLGVPCLAERGNVRARSRERGISIEMAARELRHAFLAKIARAKRIRAIALAHHADDQVELFFLRLFRGSGGEGLAGMRWRSISPADKRVHLIRPLLSRTRVQLRSFAEDQRVPFREDASNATVDHQRNQIRHELLPLIKRHYRVDVGQAVLRAIEVIGGESEFVRETASRWLKSSNDEPFEGLPVCVQRRCLQIQLVGKGVEPGFELIERLRLHPNRVFAAVGGGRISRTGRGRLAIELDVRHEFEADSCQLDLKKGRGSLEFGGLTLKWHRGRLGVAQAVAVQKVDNCEYFDADKVGERVILRHWRPGDRFRPIGMKGSMKLQDWFTNLKLPSPWRRQLVVAESAKGELFWVEGLRISECFKLDKRTRRRIKWQWKRHADPKIASGTDAC